jgi:integrase/recombinase XerD
MSGLQQTVADYLALRRSLGFKLKEDGRRLLDFASFLKKARSPFITIHFAVKWASEPPAVSAQTAARRLGIVRGFAKFARIRDPRHEVPPRETLPSGKTRPVPYIYSRAEQEALVEEFRAFHACPFNGLTSSTFFGLLTVTGMRVGEAIALDRTDFDPREGILTIRWGKFGKSREAPLHETAQTALRRYERMRDRILPRPKSPAFFLSGKGTRLLRQNVSMTFARVLRRTGLSDRKPRRPRIHDLRHSFAVNTLCDWYRAGLNVEAQLPLLSTYLGHVSPSSTYWYLTAVPELVGLAVTRLERAMGDLP